MGNGVFGRFLLITVLVASPISAVAGQREIAQHSSPPPTPQSQLVPDTSQAVMPDGEKILMLIRTALLTLNDAIQTGNFTVLRDRAAPSFRETNSAARLSEIFSSLVSQGIDLSAVATLGPKLTQPPSLDPQSHMLRLAGVFPGKTVQIRFDILFQPVAGRWRLFGLSVQPQPATTELPALPAGPAASESTKIAPKK
jgi:hypothetical protein